ncbi:ABC transporter permease [Hoeflea prorocentri]|uniref:ABC transporter permease n=1 Tax=Hoeflea prorocentri TaxID=1922333 RepID=A0A9X3ZI22_9HYPH|nr:ABC transporter permease [Hoeflea prorocentri]MCY6381553.1 ABC transporter permease [Hoeflea prorocentri]MDA5399353.1 ABC transporter permease [Hoeflea prorocentri]
MENTQKMPLSLSRLSNLILPIAFVAVIIIFSIASESFLSFQNFYNVVANKVVLLAIVSLGMTIVIAAGGIDLSVGVSVDMSALVFFTLLAAGYSAVFGVAGGLFAAFCVGALNAFLINKLKIDAFLATLGVLFIGSSVQRLSTNGGTPITLTTEQYAPTFRAISDTQILGLALPIWILILCSIAVYVVLHKMVFGRYVAMLGAKPGVALYSGVRVPRELSKVFVFCSVLCGIAGILLSSQVKSYIPLSGDAFLLDAIGATFIGTALTSDRRPSVLGTLMGVFLLAIMRNGLLLIGWNFFWQQVGIGVLIFVVLALSFGLKKRGE